MRGEEAGVRSGGGLGDLLDGSLGVVDAGQHRRAKDAGGDTRVPQLAHGGEAQVGAGCARLELAGELGIGGGDRDVDDQGVSLGYAL